MFKPGQKPPSPKPPAAAKPQAKRKTSPELMRAQAAALRKPKAPPPMPPGPDEGGY